jgi:hypothetical protein
MSHVDVFEHLTWLPGRLCLGDLIFEIDEDGKGRKVDGPPGLTFLKPRRMIEQYAELWKRRPDFSASSILELGIHRGGSVAFWFEVFQPTRLVALDIAPSSHGDDLEAYLGTRQLRDRIALYWETDQADVTRLRELLATEFSGPVDLIIDDASHFYPLTKVSFETLFPCLRPGGLYIIEDWSWACWPILPRGFNPSMALPRLINEIVRATGTMAPFLSRAGGFYHLRPLIASVQVFPDIVVIERGSADASSVRLENGASGSSVGRLRETFRRWRNRLLHRTVVYGMPLMPQSLGSGEKSHALSITRMDSRFQLMLEPLGSGRE